MLYRTAAIRQGIPSCTLVECRPRLALFGFFQEIVKDEGSC